jgi:hypothetical protein
MRAATILAVPLAFLLVPVLPARAQSTIHHVVGVKGDWLGWSVAGIGDITHDGVPDFAVGAPGLEPGPAGYTGGLVRVCSGADGVVLATLHGTGAANGNFGWQVAAAGDVNADGTPDIIVGEPNPDALAIESGVAWVFSGADFSVLYAFAGNTQHGKVGDAVSGAGDVNADGHADLLIHSTTYLSVFILSGLDGTIIREVAGQTEPDASFMSVAPAGDVNKDGFDDALVGFAYDDVGPLESAGSAWLFSGRDGSILFEWHGTHVADELGYAVASAGDADADGIPDLAVSSLGNDGLALNGGSVSIFSGADGSLLHRIEGGVFAGGLGWDVAGLGDVDGDGHDDVAASRVFSYQTPFSSSAVFVHSGADAHVLMTLTSNTDVTFFGRSIAGVGDMDGDGGADILVGSTAEPAGGVYENAGAAWVYSSQPWTDLGFGLAGSSGTPQLTGAGTLAGGSLTTLHLTGALPGGSAVLIAGAGLLQAPFKGGTLVPTLDLLAFGLPISAGGALDLSFPWPTFLPPTTIVRFQYWIPASGGPQGFSASNALAGVQP